MPRVEFAGRPARSALWIILGVGIMVALASGALNPAEEDWYKVLGIDRMATEKEIRTAYRKLVLKWHPDKNPGKEDTAQVQTARLNNAYEVLSDAAAKRDFDNRFFTDAPRTARPAAPPSARTRGKSASQKAKPAAQDEDESSDGVDQYGEEEEEAPRGAPFDPRNPGASWDSWQQTGEAKGFSDSKQPRAKTQSFYERAFERTAMNLQTAHTAWNPQDAKHRSTEKAAKARDWRQRVRDEKFQGFRNKQAKKQLKRERKQPNVEKNKARKARERVMDATFDSYDKEVADMVLEYERRQAQGQTGPFPLRQDHVRGGRMPQQPRHNPATAFTEQDLHDLKFNRNTSKKSKKGGVGRGPHPGMSWAGQSTWC
mmetsp:Transcript_46160/g.108325  ORF Transcript_46160/g.108325 Transcript_46160/m.108325 type:complete len:371 (+) Transcript_46160:122-1234(+)